VLKLSVKSKVKLGFDVLLVHYYLSVPYLELECESGWEDGIDAHVY